MKTYISYFEDIYYCSIIDTSGISFLHGRNYGRDDSAEVEGEKNFYFKDVKYGEGIFINIE